jgi:predicted transcriptional regulator
MKDILAVASSKDATKTEIVYRSNINFVAAERYVSRLLVRGLLESVRSEDGRVRFRTTTTGRELLDKIADVQRLVDGNP